MVGQKKLLDLFDKFTIDTLPQSILLVGEYGCGKHELCKYMSEKLNIGLEDISDNLTSEKFEEISQRVQPFLYVVDGNNITAEKESKILKTLEEPYKNTYLFILIDNINNVLNTIANRCSQYYFEPYSKEELSKFSVFTDNSDVIYEIANTPGKIIEYEKEPITNIIGRANLILDKIGTANFPNTLTLSNQIYFKDKEDNKYNYQLFVRILHYCSKMKYINESSKYRFEAFKLTTKLLNESQYKNNDKKLLFENYLYNLRELMRGEMIHDSEGIKK